MLGRMTMLMQRCRAAGFAVAILVTGAAAGVRAEGERSPSQNQPAPTRTTTVVSTEAGGTVPSEPAPPEVAPAPVPALPNAAPPVDPTPPNGVAASSEPPAPSQYDPTADADPAALEDFRDTLSPYGTWEDDATYGVVWMPSSVVVGVDFTPYVSDGHWGLGADSSWLWVSDFNWGWAPFHYGRWVWIGGRGWAWIPGRVYAPAWVVWRTGFYDDYYIGWAPMPPTWYWWHGWAHHLGHVPPAPYVFCSSTYVFAPHVRMHIAPPGRVNMIAPRTRPYIAASPNVPSSGQPLPGQSSFTMTRGPSMVDAHVPAASVPTQRVAPDARAVSFTRAHPPSRSPTPQTGAFTGRGDVMPRPFPSSPGSTVHTTRPLPPTGASMSGPQVYTPRPVSPPSTPIQPVMPSVPHLAPVTPSIPRPYSPPSAPVARPAPTPVVGPASPAPVVRPAAPPAANVPPSAAAPHPAAPAGHAAPASPRTSK